MEKEKEMGEEGEKEGRRVGKQISDKGMLPLFPQNIT